MAVFIKDKEVVAIYRGSKVITRIYRGVNLVWEAVRSCFSKGFWVNTLPWVNDDAWRNNI